MNNLGELYTRIESAPDEDAVIRLLSEYIGHHSAPLHTRIAELEADRQWRPIKDAPKDGTEVVGRREMWAGESLRRVTCWVAGANGVRGYWAIDPPKHGAWNPTHFISLPPGAAE